MAIISKISPARQIRATETYEDTLTQLGLADQNAFAAGAEGTGYLEEDLNYLRTQINRIVGQTNWYDNPSVNLETLTNVSNKVIIQPVQLNGITFASGSTALTGITSGVAALSSGSNVGYVYDSAGTPAVDTYAKVTVRDAVTNSPLVDASENMIYGVLTFDGSDGGTVTGTAGGLLGIDLYTDVNGTATPSTYSGTVEVLIPQRTTIANASENFAMINAGFASATGSIELGDRRWVTLDTTDGTYKVTTGDNTELSLSQNVDVTNAINAIIPQTQKAYDLAQGLKSITGISFNEASTWSVSTDLTTEWNVGTTTNYLDGTVQTSYLDAFSKLDSQLKVVENLAINATPDTQVLILSSLTSSGTPVTIPNSKTYANTDVNAMGIFLNGQKLVSDNLAGGANQGDYAETSTTTVTFNFNLTPGDVITFVIYKS